VLKNITSISLNTIPRKESGALGEMTGFRGEIGKVQFEPGASCYTR
jgi:hypothetical protein